jgi:mono/diheme cytochrome c family protein
VKLLQRITVVVELIVVAAVSATVVLMFANKPTAPPAAPPAVVAAAGGIDGAALYGKQCAGCHGGDGSGGIGPRLAERVLVAYPDPAAQIAVVTNGRGRGMPAFGTRLTPDEIAAIVAYTRTVLSGS